MQDPYRTYRLRSGGVECGADGFTVAGLPLLRRAESGEWAPRPSSEIERALTGVYRAAIDPSGKVRGLRVVAEALNVGELARAQVATLLLKILDPEEIEATGSFSFETLSALSAGGWLEKDWDPAKHPRAGGAPSSGWFAPTGGGTADSPSTGFEPRSKDSKMRERLAGDRNDCFRICSDLAIPTGDFGIAFQRCVLDCTSNGNSGFPEWDSKFKQ
jgi:hypothetical protein